MSNDRINRITIVGTGLIALVVFGALCIRHNVPAIEAELAARATAALQSERLGWAEVNMDGRDLVLSGIAPDAAARDAALRVAAVDGVHRVEDQLVTIAERSATSSVPGADQATELQAPAPAPFITHLTVADGRLLLAGATPGEVARRALVRRAQNAFGIAAVEARLEVQPDAPADWEQAIGVALGLAQHLVLGEIIVQRSALEVSGVTADEQADTLVRESLAQNLPEGYTFSVSTGSRGQLDEALRGSPSLAERVANADPRAVPEPALEALPALDMTACEREFRQRLGVRPILFDTGSATLTADSRSLLSVLALVLKRCPATRIAIEGHTDDQGRLEDNLALSQRRAEEVMLYLVSEGIGLGRLSARGFGEERPLVPNETADARARNRRIEFVFES